MSSKGASPLPSERRVTLSRATCRNQPSNPFTNSQLRASGRNLEVNYYNKILKGSLGLLNQNAVRAFEHKDPDSREDKMVHLLPLKTQEEASKNNIRAKCHKRDVQVWGVDIINWGLIGKPAPNRFSYSCPVTLSEKKYTWSLTRKK